MQTIAANKVEMPYWELDYGEAQITFTWPDELYGYEQLTLTPFEGHVSRRMPLYSGSGLLGVELERDSITFHFDTATAKQLRMDEDVEITFTIDDGEFVELLRGLQAAGLVADRWE